MVVKARQDWAKTNHHDVVKVAELRKDLLRAEEAEGNTRGTSAMYRGVSTRGRM